MSSPNPLPTVGRIVHFAYGEDACAALVTAVHDTGPSIDHAGDVDLTVFLPSKHHEKAGQSFTTRAAYDADGLPATWRYPPRV
jgi:hypothetical protein